MSSRGFSPALSLILSLSLTLCRYVSFFYFATSALFFSSLKFFVGDIFAQNGRPFFISHRILPLWVSSPCSPPHFSPLKNQLDNTTNILPKAKRKKNFLFGCHTGNNLRQHKKKEQQTEEEVAKGSHWGRCLDGLSTG